MPLVAAVAVSLEELLARLRTAAEVAERVHRENLLLFAEEALRLLSKGDVRDAAEKAWAAYKSLLGLLIAKKLLPVIEEEAKKIAEKKGAEKAREYIEWWIEQGFLIPSTRQKLDTIVEMVAEATGDREIVAKEREAAHLHVFFYHGPDIAEMSEKRAAEAVKDIINWIKMKAKEYGLL